MDVIETIRRACKQSPTSQYRIAKDTGIDKSALSRFVNGERGLSMEGVDALCRYLRLELKPKARKAR